MSSLTITAREYSLRGEDFDSEPIGLKGMGTTLIVCLVLAAIGGLLYCALKDKIDDDKSSCLGCLGMLGAGFLILAGLGFFCVGWSLIMAFVVTPIFYIVSYVFLLLIKLAAACFVVIIIPAILIVLTEILIEKITQNKTVPRIFTVIALAGGLAIDAYLYSLLPPKTITVEAFFPEWTLGEQIDMQLHPEKYEDEDEEDQDEDEADQDEEEADYDEGDEDSNDDSFDDDDEANTVID